MKKIDKLILQAFIGPLMLTFLVVVFILLTRHMLYYFDDIIGKDLGIEVLMQFLLHFAILMIPSAMPLAVLLASLITFGDLAEHFELTAIKSTGISLLRVLRPIFLFVLCLTAIALYANNYLVPKAALEAFSLLHDIKHKKPAMDIREGVFYDGLPDISIKVNRKFAEDAAALKDIILYDHQAQDGSTEVIIADSGRMFTILNERYLKVALFKGYQYSEIPLSRSVLTPVGQTPHESLSRREFSSIEMVYDLSSFNLTRTSQKLFETSYRVRNMAQLDVDIDSMKNLILQQRLAHHMNSYGYFSYYRKNDAVKLPPEVQAYKLKKDSALHAKYPAAEGRTVNVQQVFKEDTSKEVSSPGAGRSPAPYNSGTGRTALANSLFVAKPALTILQAATNAAREVKSNVQDTNLSMENYGTELSVFRMQWQKIPASAMACIAMFLIGAPLGAIIRRGGLGLPFLVSIFFFIVYTLLGMHGEKLAKQDMLGVTTGIWGANLILLVTGFIFLRIARDDGRLFDADSYRILIKKIMRKIRKLAVI